MSLTTPAAGRTARSRPVRAAAPWWAVGALALSVLVVGLDSYVLVTALPTLSAKLWEGSRFRCPGPDPARYAVFIVLP